MNNLQLGFKAHQAGQLQQAQQLYLKHLSVAHNDPDALQLLGLVYSALGDFDNAVTNMQRSLSINSNQPHVLNNLGVCQKNKGLPNDAKASFEQAIRQKKDYLDPYKNLIRLLLDISLFDEAEKALAQALSLFPNEVAIAKLNANYHQNIEDYPTAIKLYETLYRAQPESAVIKHDLALNYRLAGQPARALELYSELEKTGLSQFQFFHNKANALSDLGRLQDAVEYYRKALKVNPAYVESHVNLNELLWELGESATLLTSYREAFPLVPDNPELRFSYVSALLRISQFQSALDFLKQVPGKYKNHYQYFDLAGQALKGVSKEAEAIETQANILSFNNAPADALLNFAETLLQAGQHNRAEEVIDRALKIEPESKYGWALMGIAWQMSGDPREAILNDYDNLVREYTIEIPDGFDSVEQFCEKLNEYLVTLHTADRQPLEQTLTGGTQTRGNLFQDSNPLVQALVDKLKLCIADYVEKTAPLAGKLPVIKSSETFEFSGSWSVCLKGEGFHTQHVHPMGWLSSAFYVQLPQSVEDERARQGWFKLGEPNIELPTPALAKKYIKPAVGKLVLFQSYMWHGTIPFDSEQTRVTVAFDVAHAKA